MNDPIDRQAAIDSITNLTFSVTIGGKRGFQDYKEEVEKVLVTISDKYIEALKALPSAEPEIIRCKDCKFASYEPCKDYVDVYVCNYSYWTRAQGGRNPDWHCAWAERREDADTN